jgi:hypothetical protein
MSGLSAPFHGNLQVNCMNAPCFIFPCHGSQANQRKLTICVTCVLTAAVVGLHEDVITTTHIIRLTYFSGDLKNSKWHATLVGGGGGGKKFMAWKTDTIETCESHTKRVPSIMREKVNIFMQGNSSSVNCILSTTDVAVINERQELWKILG